MAITAAEIGESIAPIHGMVKGGGEILEVTMTVTMSNSYPTGGEVLTLPTDIKYGDVQGITIVNPFPAVGTDRVYLWNGSTTAPKIGAKVISTAAEVANATDLSADTLILKVLYTR